MGVGKLKLPMNFRVILIRMSSGKLDKKYSKLNKNAKKTQKEGKCNLTKQGKRGTNCTKVRKTHKACSKNVIFLEKGFECFA